MEDYRGSGHVGNGGVDVYRRGTCPLGACVDRNAAAMARLPVVRGADLTDGPGGRCGGDAQAGAGKAIDTVVSSEALLNDGVGVVLFLTILHAAAAPGGITVLGVGRLLAQEALGGAVLGFCTGLFIYHLLKQARNFQVEVLLTLALVMGTYSLASALNMWRPSPSSLPDC